jgi:hypothetical protein
MQHRGIFRDVVQRVEDEYDDIRSERDRVRGAMHE